jgi:uncharacterized protein YkwD
VPLVVGVGLVGGLAAGGEGRPATSSAASTGAAPASAGTPGSDRASRDAPPASGAPTGGDPDEAAGAGDPAADTGAADDAAPSPAADDPSAATAPAPAPPAAAPAPQPAPPPPAPAPPPPAPAPPPPPPPAPPASSSGTRDVESRLLALADEARRAAGLTPLRAHDGLTSVARGWSEQLAATGASLAHNPDYASQVPGGWSAVGENVAWIDDGGTLSPEEVARRMHQGWMDSPGHRENILRPGYTHLGVGVGHHPEHGWYLTQNFATY